MKGIEGGKDGITFSIGSFLRSGRVELTPCYVRLRWTGDFDFAEIV